jgi:hypothetical protein
MRKTEAELELLLRDLRENITRIRRFARQNKLDLPTELQPMETRPKQTDAEGREA